MLKLEFKKKKESGTRESLVEVKQESEMKFVVHNDDVQYLITTRCHMCMMCKK